MAAASPRPFRFAAQAFEATSGKEWTEIARRTEDLGYSTLFTTDHYFGPGSISESSGHRPVDVAPIAAMTAAAAVTTDLRVGCRVFNVDLHQPVVLAKELATLDMLSDGRLEVGLGAGWVAAEYEGLGVPMDRPGVRIDRLGEVVELMKAHWSGDEVAVDGTYVHAHGFAGLPAAGAAAAPADLHRRRARAHPHARRPAGRHRQHQLRQLGRPARRRRASPAPAPARRRRSWSGCGPARATGSTRSSSRSAPTSSPSTTTRRPMITAMAGRFGVSEEEFAVPPARPARQRRLDLRHPAGAPRAVRLLVRHGAAAQHGRLRAGRRQAVGVVTGVMRLGAVFPTTEIGNDPIAVRDYAQAAEALGCVRLTAYDHVLGADHADREPPLRGPYTQHDPFHEPFVLFGFLAAHTTRIELATGVLVLPQRQTALVAKQAAEVDLLSGGRLVLGVGTGWNHVEYTALGTTFRDRARRFDDQVDVLRALWEQELVDARERRSTASSGPASCRGPAVRSRCGWAARPRPRWRERHGSATGTSSPATATGTSTPPRGSSSCSPRTGRDREHVRHGHVRRLRRRPRRVARPGASAGRRSAGRCCRCVR